MSRRILATGPLLGLVALTVLVTLIIWMVARPNVSDERDDTQHRIRPDDKPRVEAQRDPPELIAEKEALRSRVVRFAATYYGRDKQLYMGTIDEAQVRYEERLDPLVTEAFLEDYVPPLDTPPDQWAKRAGARITANANKKTIYGHFHTDHAEVLLTVCVVPKLDDRSFDARPIDIAMTLVKQNDVWLVDTVEERIPQVPSSHPC